jgi:hypothetical protein
MTMVMLTLLAIVGMLPFAMVMAWMNQTEGNRDAG